MSFLKWFTPGINLKRWFFLHFVALLLLIIIVNIILNNWSSNPFLIIMLLPGISLYLISLLYLYKRFITLHKIKEKKNFADIVFDEHRLSKGPKIVAIGGGTGLSAVLTGLKKLSYNITAIVTVSDDGGSSGILRESYDVLPPGDMRNCLVALADSEPLMRKLFQYRFPEEKPLSGHTVGNLVILGLTNILGNFETALRETSKILAIRGKVVPASLTKINLTAKNTDGSYTEGEHKITQSVNKIEQVFIYPENAPAATEAVEAIKSCDVLIIGPGSLYTSIMPNLLIKGIKDAIIKSSSTKIYICNIMTQEGETRGYTAYDHIEAIEKHCGTRIFDSIIAHKKPIDDRTLEKYKYENAYPVAIDEDAIISKNYRLFQSNVVSVQDVVRHDGFKIAQVIDNIVTSYAGKNDINKKAVCDPE